MSGGLHHQIVPAVTDLLARCGWSADIEDQLVAVIRQECAARRENDARVQFQREQNEREARQLRVEIKRNEQQQRAVERAAFLQSAIAAAAAAWDDQQRLPERAATVVPLRLVGSEAAS